MRLARRSLWTYVRVYPADEVTTREPPPRSTRARSGSTAADVDEIWASVVRLYETGLHPAIALCVRRRGKVVIDRAIGHARGNAPGDAAPRPRCWPRRARSSTSTRRRRRSPRCWSTCSTSAACSTSTIRSPSTSPSSAGTARSGSRCATSSRTAPASPPIPGREGRPRLLIADPRARGRAALRHAPGLGRRAGGSRTTRSPAATSSARWSSASPAATSAPSCASEVLEPLGLPAPLLRRPAGRRRRGRARTRSPARRRCRPTRGMLEARLRRRHPRGVRALQRSALPDRHHPVGQHHRHGQRGVALLPAAPRRRRARRRARLRRGAPCSAPSPSRASSRSTRPSACRCATAWASCSAASG